MTRTRTHRPAALAFVLYLGAATAVVGVLTVTSWTSSPTGPPFTPLRPVAPSVARCPEDAVRLVTDGQAGACIAGDDFAPGTTLRRAADGVLGTCPVGHARVLVEHKPDSPTQILTACQ